jgi:hypothetical protein
VLAAGEKVKDGEAAERCYCCCLHFVATFKDKDRLSGEEETQNGNSCERQDQGEATGGRVRACIHRGTKEIGGTCVEIEWQGKRIVLDVGLP